MPSPKIVAGEPGARRLEKANWLGEFKIDYLIGGEIKRVFGKTFLANERRQFVA